MVDEPKALDYLREQFALLHLRFDRRDARLDEVSVRLGAVQREVVSLSTLVRAARGEAAAAAETHHA